MKNLLGLIGALMLILYNLLPAWGAWHVGPPELTADEVFALWYPLETKQSDGRIFSMDLPVQAESEKEMTIHTPYESLDRYEASEDGLELEILHGVLRDPQAEVGFDLESLKGRLRTPGSMMVQGEGIRLAGGHPLHLIEGVDGESAKEYLGYRDGRDVWIFYFRYGKDDEETKALINQSIDSMDVN